MIDSETLYALGLSGEVLPAWTVLVYVVLTSLFVLMHRTQLHLLTTHLFSIYWGFLLYWEGYLVGSNAFLTAFAIYTFCGLAVVSLAVIAYIKQDRNASIVESAPRTLSS